MKTRSQYLFCLVLCNFEADEHFFLIANNMKDNCLKQNNIQKKFKIFLITKLKICEEAKRKGRKLIVKTYPRKMVLTKYSDNLHIDYFTDG